MPEGLVINKKEDVDVGGVTDFEKRKIDDFLTALRGINIASPTKREGEALFAFLVSKLDANHLDALDKLRKAINQRNETK
ncbi:MAG: hypothetical protein NTZ87_02405 [Candidatus Nomurabacteria bacterium]|nr:hypothetical protein [Candidatus Nomurabacteria bacterium]